MRSRQACVQAERVPRGPHQRRGGDPAAFGDRCGQCDDMRRDSWVQCGFTKNEAPARADTVDAMAPLRSYLPESARRVGHHVLHALLAPAALPVLVVAAALARARRPSRRGAPRIVWGPL